jgi:ribosome recycling factor
MKIHKKPEDTHSVLFKNLKKNVKSLKIGKMNVKLLMNILIRIKKILMNGEKYNLCLGSS